MNFDEKEKDEYENDLDDNNEEYEEESYEDYVDESTDNSLNNDDMSSLSKDKDLKKKLVKLMVIIGICMAVLLVVLFLITTILNKKYDYEDIEEVMQEAAESYFKDNSKSLPQDETQTVEIDVATLVAAEKMKSIDKYLGEGSGCSGKVLVKKAGTSYIYTPYLTCKDKYSTQFLADTVTKEENLVGSGYGLYLMNDSYVFRGENVNNFVQLEARMWRIVRVNSDKTITLVLEKGTNNEYPYDDRYNQEADYDNGINNFQASRAREQLQLMYNETDKEEADLYILSEKDKIHLVNTDLCVGKMSKTDTIHDNSIECKELFTDKIGLLTVSDFMNASTDQNCNTVQSSNCQNYNYLVTNGKFWLMTPSTKNSYTVFNVSAGEIKESTADRTSKIRPIITLSANTLISGGTGTEEDPYVIR